MVQNPVWKQKKNGRIHATGHDRAFVIIVYALLALITLLILYPLIFVLSASISDPNAVNSGKVSGKMDAVCASPPIPKMMQSK